MKEAAKKYLVKAFASMMLVLSSAFVNPVSAKDSVIVNDESNGSRNYTITIHTSDEDYSGTDNEVYIKFYGDKGETDFALLSSGGDDFETGSTETFTVSLKDVGNVDAIGFEMEMPSVSFSGYSWTVEYVTFEGSTYRTTKKNYFGNDILATIGVRRNEGIYDAPDNRTLSEKREAATYKCLLNDSNKIDLSQKDSTTEYTTVINTGDSGTDGDVLIKYIGKSSETEWSFCDKRFYDDFEPNDSDKYSDKLLDVGEVKKISIKLERGSKKTWDLSSIVYEGKTYHIDKKLNTEQEVTVDLESGKVSGPSEVIPWASSFSSASIWMVVALAEAVMLVAACIFIFAKKKNKQ